MKGPTAMSVYWLAFRLGNDKSYGLLLDAIDRVSSTWWMEPSSFFLFESGADIDDIASRVSRVIDTAKDVVLIGMIEAKNARVVGNVADPILFHLMPFVVKADRGAVPGT
jgi:hypothetical protein